MTTTTNTASRTKVDASYETSKFSLAVGLSMAVIVGIWGVASLVSALASTGPIALVKSYIGAVIGM